MTLCRLLLSQVTRPIVAHGEAWRCEMYGWVEEDLTREHRRDLMREAEGRPVGPSRRNREECSGVPVKMRVRWGLAEDEWRVAELLELNGQLRVLAFEDRFVVAEEGSRLLGALGYRTEAKRMRLGLLAVDPWAREGDVAEALYAGAGVLARELRAREVLAGPVPYGDHPRQAGYLRRGRLWRLDPSAERNARPVLPAAGWRRLLALLGRAGTPFFRAFGG
jgi:hypothetical protein